MGLPFREVDNKGAAAKAASFYFRRSIAGPSENCRMQLAAGFRASKQVSAFEYELLSLRAARCNAPSFYECGPGIACTDNSGFSSSTSQGRKPARQRRD